MDKLNAELASDWVNYAKASLETRIRDTEQSTRQVLSAVQAIAAQLNDKHNLEPLLALKSDQAKPAEILALLHELLEHLDSQDALAQLIAPLFTALQFEDRTKQKLEGVLHILSVWTDVRSDDSITDEDLSSRLMQHVVTREQRAILAKFFPEYIEAEENEEDEIELF